MAALDTRSGAVDLPASTGCRTRDLEVFSTSDPASTLWDETTQVEAGVFIEKGYVRSRAELAHEYLPYLASSMMLSLRYGEEVIGASRYIDYDPKIGLKTLNDVRLGRLLLDDAGVKIVAGLDLSLTAEIGTVALKPEYRAPAGHKYAGMLYGAMYQRAIKSGTKYVIASFDEKYFGGFFRKFGAFTTPLGPAVDYMGSRTLPACMDIGKVSAEMFD